MAIIMLRAPIATSPFMTAEDKCFMGFALLLWIQPALSILGMAFW
jgi:hypothetical protein